MLKGLKYRIYPTRQQAELLDRHFDACRLVYNLALEVKIYAYTSHRKNISGYELIGQLVRLKKQFPWLLDIDSQALQQSVLRVDKTFSNFFKGQSGFPRFKSSKNKDSFCSPHGSRLSIIDKRVVFPKFKEGIMFTQDRAIDGKIKSSVVSKSVTGKYYISILVETSIAAPEKQPLDPAKTLGIDLGLTHFAITSEGVKIDNPRYLQKAMSHLKFLQRQASKKKKGSSNRKKANLKVALCHEKITNKRTDFLHKLSTTLVSDNQALCFEDLNVEGMKQNHCLAQGISSASWSEFLRMCKYKAEWQGKYFIQIPTFQPSTKICNECGLVNKNLTLAVRSWTCECGAAHDRDINAAINIKKYCVGVQRGKSAELPELFGAMKQETTRHASNNNLKS